MLFRLIKTSESSSVDPYIEGARVEYLGEDEYPEYVQYIEINTLEELFKLISDTNRKKVVLFSEDHRDDLHSGPLLEIYDSWRE